jgi:hypothetical protein
MPLVNLKDYKNALARNDAAKEQWIKAAQSAVQRYCGWHVSPIISEQITVDGVGGVDLYLPTLRAIEVKDVYNNGVLVPEDDYSSSRDGYMRLYTGSWSNRLSGIKLTLEHGYEMDDIEELRALILTIAGRAEASPQGVTQEASGARTITFSRFAGGSSGGVAIFDHEYALLNRYKLQGEV